MKRRIFAVLTVLCFALALAGAQSVSSTPKDAKSMGMGGSFISTSSGFSALYGNPAAFAADKGEFSMLDLSVWTYFKPTSENIQLAGYIADNGFNNSTGKSAISKFVTENGLGGGMSAGLGWVGKGIGLGAYIVGDTVAYGSTVTGATVQAETVMNAVLGLGIPIKLGGIRINVGGDIRPFYKVISAGGWPFSDFLPVIISNGDLGSVLMGEPVYSGFGLSVDLGAQLWLGNDLNFGVAVRDLTPSVSSTQGTVQSVLDQMQSGNFDLSLSGSSSYTPNITAGVSWTATKLTLLTPTVCFEIQDPITVIENGESAWNLIHAGAELKVFKVFAVRAGLNKGWLSAGAGINLVVLEINAAAFTEELGSNPGSQGRSGLALSAAIHL